MNGWDHLCAVLQGFRVYSGPIIPVGVKYWKIIVKIAVEMFNIAYNFMFKYYSFKFNIHLHYK